MSSQVERTSFFEGNRYLIAPPPHLEYFSFGYQSLIADALWVRAIQDFDYCEIRLAENICRGNSWLAQMLDAITRLAPDFKEAYRIGGLALSVLITDVEGASKLFDKGTRIFPNDFQLIYRAGYHALYEEKNISKAAHLFRQAARLQGPDGTWLYSLASRLYTEAGQRDLGIQLYDEIKKSGVDEGTLQMVRQRLGLRKPAN